MRRSEVLGASPRMFESDLLDRFTRVHPAVPAVLYGPVVAVLGWWGVARLGAPAGLALPVAGYALWTLVEYWIHRALFHLKPRGALGARLHWMIHSVHHDHPGDPLRLVMPPLVSVPLALAFLGLFWAALGAERAAAFGSGFLSGYLAYDLLHFALHHRRPRSALGRRLRALHLRHHFEDDTRGFGISAPYWDRVFGTAPSGRRAQP